MEVEKEVRGVAHGRVKARIPKGGGRGTQVPLYLESPEAEYIPTYLPSIRTPLLSPHLPSFLLFPARPIVSPSSCLPTLGWPPLPSSSPSSRGSAQVISLEVHAMMHAMESNQWFACLRRQRASRRRHSFSFSLSLLFFLSSSSFRLFCRARETVQRREFVCPGNFSILSKRFQKYRRISREGIHAVYYSRENFQTLSLLERKYAIEFLNLLLFSE